jgi:hypothetical protein
MPYAQLGATGERERVAVVVAVVLAAAAAVI